MREDIRSGKCSKSRRTGGHSDQYSGWTSTINKAVLDGESGGQWDDRNTSVEKDALSLPPGRDFLGDLKLSGRHPCLKSGGPSIFSSS